MDILRTVRISGKVWMSERLLEVPSGPKLFVVVQIYFEAIKSVIMFLIFFTHGSFDDIARAPQRTSARKTRRGARVGVKLRALDDVEFRDAVTEAAARHAHGEVFSKHIELEPALEDPVERAWQRRQTTKTTITLRLVYGAAPR